MLYKQKWSVYNAYMLKIVGMNDYLIMLEEQTQKLSHCVVYDFSPTQSNKLITQG